jgi:acyl-coenzyme A synthetase/AMP-(fatty) acid ligase
VVSVLGRGPETAVCYLGVAACATYVPLNPDFGEAELARYLRQLRPAAVIVPEGRHRTVRACASELGIRVIDLASRISDPAGAFSLVQHQGPGSTSCIPDWNGADDYSLILLTSGSTRPRILR